MESIVTQNIPVILEVLQNKLRLQSIEYAS